MDHLTCSWAKSRENEKSSTYVHRSILGPYLVDHLVRVPFDKLEVLAAKVVRPASISITEIDRGEMGSVHSSTVCLGSRLFFAFSFFVSQVVCN